MTKSAEIVDQIYWHLCLDIGKNDRKLSIFYEKLRLFWSIFRGQKYQLWTFWLENVIEVVREQFRIKNEEMSDFVKKTENFTFLEKNYRIFSTFLKMRDFEAPPSCDWRFLKKWTFYFCEKLKKLQKMINFSNWKCRLRRLNNFTKNRLFGVFL